MTQFFRDFHIEIRDEHNQHLLGPLLLSDYEFDIEDRDVQTLHTNFMINRDDQLDVIFNRITRSFKIIIHVDDEDLVFESYTIIHANIYNSFLFRERRLSIKWRASIPAPAWHVDRWDVGRTDELQNTYYDAELDWLKFGF